MTTTITGATGVNQITDDAITAAKLPTGSVIQVQENFSATSVATSAPAGSASALYGLMDGRVYGDLTSVTITPTNANSKFYISISCGMSSTTASNRGAFGIALVKDNTTGYERSTHPWYPAASNVSNYAPDQNQTHIVDATSANAVTFYFKGYAYNEGSANQAQVVSFRNAQITVMEIAG